MLYYITVYTRRVNSITVYTRRVLYCITVYTRIVILYHYVQ